MSINLKSRKGKDTKQKVEKINNCQKKVRKKSFEEKKLKFINCNINWLQQRQQQQNNGDNKCQTTVL